MAAFNKQKRNEVPTSDAPLSRGLLFGMVMVIGILGFIIQTEMQIPMVILAAVGALGGLMLLLFGLARPEVPLYLFAAYIPFSKQLAGDFGGMAKAFNLTNAFLVIILLGWFTGTASSKKPSFEPNRLHVPVLLIMFWGFISFAATTATYGEWYVSNFASEFKRWLDPIIIYFLFFHLVHDKQRWKNLVIIMLISVTVVAAMAVWEYQGIASSSSLETSRVYGIADNPNSLGAFFVYYMFILAAFWLQKGQQVRRWWLALAFLLCFRGIMVTFSRGAYVAFGLGLIALAFGRSKVLFGLLCGLMIFAVINPVVLPPGIRYRLVESTFKNQHEDLVDAYSEGKLESQVDTSAGMRLIIWDGAKRMIQEHPLFGVGLGLFKRFIMQYAALPKPFDAHNAYLLAASEQGIPMLLFILFFLGMSIFLTYRVYLGTTDPFIQCTALGWLAGLLGLVVANLFGSRVNSAEVGGYFWILSALMARADRWIAEEHQEARAERRFSAREKLKAIFQKKTQTPTQQQGTEKDAKYRKYAKYGRTRPS